MPSQKESFEIFIWEFFSIFRSAKKWLEYESFEYESRPYTALVNTYFTINLIILTCLSTSSLRKPNPGGAWSTVRRLELYRVV